MPPGPAEPKRLPRLLSFLGLHLAMGAAIGVFAASAMIGMNVASLKTLIAETRQPYVAMMLFYAFNILTFASVTMGAGIMRLPFDAAGEEKEKPHEEEPPLR